MNEMYMRVYVFTSTTQNTHEENKYVYCVLYWLQTNAVTHHSILTGYMTIIYSWNYVIMDKYTYAS